jgi:hypothetical protein
MVAPEYTYPNNESVPEYLRGKTASDAAKMLNSMVEAAGRGASSVPAQPQPLPPAQDDDYVTGAHLRQAEQRALSQVNPYLQTVADQQATFAYNLVKQEDADLFKKYEPEIVAVANRVPRHLWTLDALRNAVTFVRGNHVKELLAEKTRELELTMHSTMRSTGRAGTNAGSESQETVSAMLEKSPEKWRADAKAVGITDKEVYEFCRDNDMSPEDFFKQFGSGLVTDAVTDVNFKPRHGETR